MSDVSAPAVFFTHVHSAQLDGSVSAASGALATLGKGLTNAYRRLVFAQEMKHLSGLVQKLLDKAAEGMREAESGHQSTAQASPDDLDHGLRSLEYLEMVLGRMLNSLHRYGWANDSKTAGTVKKLTAQYQQLGDINDWLHIVIRNSAADLAEIFDEARAEFRTSRSFSMDEVF